jgi:hypothetical protein
VAFVLQTAETLPQLKKIYVASLGGKQGAAELRDKLILRLKKSPAIEVVGSSSEADAILTERARLGRPDISIPARSLLL